MDIVSSGNDVLDKLLDGGFESDVISVMYGPGGIGKTNFCLILSIEAVKSGKKVVYVDTEGGFSIRRLEQLCSDSQDVLKHVFFLRPTSFQGQKQAFEKLKEFEKEDVGLIIIDSIAMLYRLEIGKNENVYSVNKELGRQMLILNQIARKKHIPVIITNQVYSNMDDGIVMVGGDLLRYQSKCLVELRKTKEGIREAIVRKHRSLPENISIFYEITGEGVSIVTENK
jgi:DNA repair protein RadB